MQAVDPYLFYLYEFRKYALLSKIVVVIGYSFNDAHINDLLKQSLEADEGRKLLIVNPNVPENIYARIGLVQKDDRIIFNEKGAKDFLVNDSSVDYISSLLPEEATPF